jgi:uncharacterized BrkB/YihY/UPF0761 family membrane protein
VRAHDLRGVLPFSILRWIGALVLMTFAFGVLVHYAPDKPRSKKWTSGGAALVVVAWLIQSLISAWYVGSVASYRSAVGSLAALHVFTTFVYVGDRPDGRDRARRAAAAGGRG